MSAVILAYGLAMASEAGSLVYHGQRCHSRPQQPTTFVTTIMLGLSSDDIALHNTELISSFLPG